MQVSHITRRLIVLLSVACILGGAALAARADDPVVDTPMLQVAATVETDPVPNSGDAADDPAIWVHPTDPAQSTIIGTDKKGGIAVYDLAGRQLQYLPDGNLNNVDLRTGFPLGGEAVTLVTASNRSTNSIAIYRVNPITRLLDSVAARTIPTPGAYGACMYRSAATGTYYYFGNSKTGEVQQWSEARTRWVTLGTCAPRSPRPPFRNVTPQCSGGSLQLLRD